MQWRSRVLKALQCQLVRVLLTPESLEIILVRQTWYNLRSTNAAKKEQSRIISFDHYSSSIWKEINVRYRGLGGSKQCALAQDICHGITADLERIAEQYGPMADPKTRYNGLSVLRKIGERICLSNNDVLAHEVQNWFQWDTRLEDSMLKIVSAMSPKGRSDITGDDSSDQALWPKLVELERLAEDNGVFRNFFKVMELLQEGGEVQYVDDVDGEDDYEDERG